MLKRKVKDFLRNKLNRSKELTVSAREWLSNKHGGSNKKTTLERNILLSAHSIEKGMGLRNFETGHGVKSVNYLLMRLQMYIERNYDPDQFVFKEGLAAVRGYIQCQEDNGADASVLANIKSQYNEIISSVPRSVVSDSEAYKCGAQSLDLSFTETENNNYEKFLKSRHSVRMFKNSRVDQKLIYRAVELANLSPSACNRQPNRVYFSNDPKMVGEIDKLITGNKGFEHEIYNYIIVTSKRAMFAGEEQFQWYTGGGIYLANLVLALHSLNLATCIMQWRAFYATEKQLKKLCKIDKNEAIIAIVGVGEYEEKTKVIFAQRMSALETLKIIS